MARAGVEKLLEEVQLGSASWLGDEMMSALSSEDMGGMEGGREYTLHIRIDTSYAYTPNAFAPLRAMRTGPLPQTCPLRTLPSSLLHIPCDDSVVMRRQISTTMTTQTSTT